MSANSLISCRECGMVLEGLKKPALTVDVIIEYSEPGGQSGIILIERQNFPKGWAIPGGFVDYGETVEAAVVREANEETALRVSLKYLLGVYSAPERDPRGHTVSVVFVAKGEGQPEAGDDAKSFLLFARKDFPESLAFDHGQILQDYLQRDSQQR